MITIQEVTDKGVWENFLTSFDTSVTPFFQSWNWGDVQKALGNTIFRLGIYKDDKLSGICLVNEVKAKRGHYLHLRHGPVLTNFDKDFDEFLQYIKTFAKSIHADFIRMSPLLLENVFDMTFLKTRGFRNAPIHNMDAENAWVLNLEASDDDLLKGMRKTTRYLVRKAFGIPLEIKATHEEEDFEAFMELYRETSVRHKFVPHRGIEDEFHIFSTGDQTKLFLAIYEGKVIAGALIVFYGNQAVYHHGATADEFKNIPAAYLLQWEAIKEAKKKGKKLYNFWGVVPEDKPKHPWQGLTLFKMGFGGERLNFIHAQDLPLNLNYWKTFAIETATKKMKGY